jgi:hypothetical protein
MHEHHMRRSQGMLSRNVIAAQEAIQQREES